MLALGLGIAERGEVLGGVETFRDLSLVDDLRKELEAKYSFADIVGRSFAVVVEA